MKKFYMTLIVAFWATTLLAQTKQDILFENFQNPGNEARPRVWWHWMNGNITQDGIRKDLLWMHRVGIGGFQNFDAGMITPQVVDKRLIYMSPEWKDAFRLTAKLADSLKLEMAIAGSPGWSESGGTWVTPKDGMKKIVWREITVKGGKNINEKLPEPFSTSGAFQNVPERIENSGLVQVPPPAPEYYQDVAVVAYKLPDTYVPIKELMPIITSSGGEFKLDQLIDGDLNKTSLLPSVANGESAWIQFEFQKPQSIKAVTVVGGGDKGAFGLMGENNEGRSLQASDDGKEFRLISYIPAGDVNEQTIDVPETTAKYFRVTFKNPSVPMGFGNTNNAPKGTEIAELVLNPNSLIDRFEEKAGFAAYSEQHPLTNSNPDEAISKSDIIDITDRMDANGNLNWKAPKGNWKILRFGYSLTGHHNGPATKEAIGLEVDKLDKDAVRRYFENYLDQYKDATGGLMGSKGLGFIITDSWEAGQENWTGQMMKEFEKRRGYSLLPWMPVLTGEIVENAEESEKFLWDFRKTLSELVVENHYDQLTEILQERGMKRYSESHESGRGLIADGMDVKRTSAVPMGAIWLPGFINRSNLTHYISDLRESASVAHVYGQNLVAAESLTAFGMIGNQAYIYSPETLKPIADLALASGLNRFVIHTSVHQPVDDKIPGLGLGPFGQWFTRHETWAEQAKPWIDYLSRSSFMLQQGTSVADVAYFYGEDNNITNLFKDRLPEIPEGYDYDYINADALINKLSFKDGRIVTPSGMSYRILMIDSSAVKMSLPLLRKLSQLVKDGAVIGGTKPKDTPSLADDKKEFQQLVNEIWNSGNVNVLEGKTVAEVLKMKEIRPDFQYVKSNNDTKLLYVHRKLGDGDLYWVNNRNDRYESIDATFRITGKIPEIWHPETGKSEPATYQISEGVTKVILPMFPNDAAFVVFQKTASENSAIVPNKSESDLLTVEGSWHVDFQPQRGAPANSVFDKLSSYTENNEEGIKYFSGTATYKKTLEVPASLLHKKSRIWLDLGDVKNIAEITLNGKSLGEVWKKPFRVDITDVVKSGDNSLEIKVTNLWVNRIIGDAQPNVKEKITFTPMPFYQVKSKLLPSGLLGPVRIISIE
jgi:hypothetical protein